MLESFEANLKVGIREEPRITEQQFGNFQNHEEMQQCKRQRNSFGRFYYRFPNGESGLDVYTRVGATQPNAGLRVCVYVNTHAGVTTRLITHTTHPPTQTHQRTPTPRSPPPHPPTQHTPTNP